MLRIARISAVFVTAIAALSMSAAAASAASTTAPASAPSAAVPTSTASLPGATPDTTCTVVGSGKPGYETFTLHVNSDNCGLTVKAAAECVLSIYQGPYSDPYVYEVWVYGPHETKAGTNSETTSCGPANVYFLTYGFQVLRNGKWTYTQIGDE
jgi:hypothetical protein